MSPTRSKVPIYLRTSLGWMLSQTSSLTRVLPGWRCRRSWPRKYSRWFVLPLSFHFFSNMSIQARYVESVGLDLSVSISPNHSSHASSVLRPLWVLYCIGNPNRISLMSKGIVEWDNIPISGLLNWPNLTRLSRLKCSCSRCSVSCDCDSLQ